MMVFMPLVLVLIGQFCCDVIGHQNVKVLVIGQLLFCCFRSFYCLFVDFVFQLLLLSYKIYTVPGQLLSALVMYSTFYQARSSRFTNYLLSISNMHRRLKAK